MSRWIDADALIMALRLEYPMMPMFKESRKEWELKTEGYRKAEEIINDAPSIDIVRCKECKHWQTDWNPEEGVDNFHFCPMVDGSRFDDFFCADGERRE